MISTMNRATIIGVSVLMAMGLVACSGDSGSPVSPSMVGPTASFSGATVQGSVNANRQSAALRSAANHEDCDHLTVEVVGTIPLLSVEVGCDGRFVITGVPEDQVVQLHIVGPETNVVVSVGAIEEGETLEVEITVDGNHVEVVIVGVTGGDDDSSDDDPSTEAPSSDFEDDEESDSVHAAKVEVCHRTGNGSFHKINVSENAVPAHRAHGDALTGEPVPTSQSQVFDDNCGALNPWIEIEKATNDDDADTAPGPLLIVPQAVVWTYVVTNTGDIALSDISVEDDQGVSVDCGGTDELAAGESMTCTGAGTAEAGPYENVGTVTAKSAPGGVEVEDSDSSHYFGGVPNVEIEKTTNGEDADTGTGPELTVGEAVDWAYEVTNTGDLPLSNVNVVDDQGVSIMCPETELEPGESMTCTGSGSAEAGQYANVGTVTADSEGGPVEDSDSSHYLGVEPS